MYNQGRTGIYDSKEIVFTFPVAARKVLYAALFDMTGAAEVETTLDTRVQLSVKEQTYLRFVSKEILYTVDIIAICIA